MASYEMGGWHNEDPFDQGTGAGNSHFNEPTSPLEYVDSNNPASPDGTASPGGPAGPNEDMEISDDVDPIPPIESPARPLNSRDVGAFIVNKMIGTGIFITPPIVLLLTKSKGEALGLWILGFIYALISMCLYLEYARKLPHTGGEIIYLDETLPRPMLFTYTIYTFYFILLYNTATNSMQFANQIIISATVPTSVYNPDQRLFRFIAVVALTFFCLLHYFSARAGRALNLVFAYTKVVMLVIVLIAGMAKARTTFEADWSRKPSTDASSPATAFLLIAFSFTGWENATFVSGEVANHQIMRRGCIGAVLVVGILYVLINMIFLLAVPHAHPVTDYAPFFFGDGFKARRAWAILIAISAGGSLLSVIYTCARVKQTIGKSNVIPWSNTWKADSPFNTTPREGALNIHDTPTPQGGLILHWIGGVVLIVITSKIKNHSEAITFPGNLQAYAAGWVGIFISIGFLFLDRRNISEPTQRNWNQTSHGQPILQPPWLRPILSKWGLAFAYFCFNTFIVVMPLIPPYRNGNGTELEVKGWYYITIVVCIVNSACIYYVTTIGNPQRTLLSLAGVRPKMHEEDVHDPQYGYRKTVQVQIESDQPSFLYWFFGGHNPDHCPNLGVFDLLDRILGR